MDKLLDAIRAAVSADSTEEAKQAGTAACRTILTALEAKPGEPMQMPVPGAPSLPIETIAAAVRGMPIDQLLDVAIARLRAAIPDAAPVKVKPLNIPLVAVPRKG